MPKSLPSLQKIRCHICDTWIADVVGVHIDAEKIKTAEFSLQANCPNRDCASRRGETKQQIVFTVVVGDPRAVEAAPAPANELDAVAITMTRKEWRALIGGIRKQDQLQMGRLPWMVVGTIEGHL